MRALCKVALRRMTPVNLQRMKVSQGRTGRRFSWSNRKILLMEEIRRSPVDLGSLLHYLQGFSTIPGGCLGILPSNDSTCYPRHSKLLPDTQ